MTTMSTIVTTTLFTDAGLFREETCASARTVSSCPRYNHHCFPCRRLLRSQSGRIFHISDCCKTSVRRVFSLLLMPQAMWLPSLLCSEKPSVTCVCPSTPRPPTEMWLQLQTLLPRECCAHGGIGSGLSSSSVVPISTAQACVYRVPTVCAMAWLTLSTVLQSRATQRNPHPSTWSHLGLIGAVTTVCLCVISG